MGRYAPLCWASITRLTSRPFHTNAIDTGRSAGDYEGALRDIVHAFKYEGRRSLASPLGALMRDAGRDLLDDARAPCRCRCTRGAASIAASIRQPISRPR